VKNNRLKIIFAITLVLVVAASALYAHGRKEEFVATFVSNLSEALSEATGTEITIGAISSNIFTSAVLSNLSCRRGNYEINFKIARLEYSLFDMMTGRRTAAAELETVITLGSGSFRSNNNLIVKDIKGKIRLTKDRFVIERFDFDLFDLLDSHVEGEITKEEGGLRIDLVSGMRPLFDKDKIFFDEIKIGVEGQRDNLSVLGRIKYAGNKDISFNGYLLSSKPGIFNIGSQIYFKDKKGRPIRDSIIMDTELDADRSLSETVVILKNGNITVNADYSKWPILEADIKNNHLKIRGLDFYNIIHMSLKTVFNDGIFSHTAVDINTESTVINYYPFDEIESSIWFDKDVARLIYLKLGDTISASGALSTKPPRNAVLKVTFADFRLDHPYLMALQGGEPAATGKLSGEMLIEGPVEELNTRISLEAKDGYLGTLKYENMIINVDGKGPLLRVYDSRIVRKDSFFPMNGVADMRNIGTDKFLEDVIISSDEQAIIWEGWDISKTNEEGALSVSKALGKGVKIGFKAATSVDETTYEPVRPQSEVGLEYDLLDEEGIFKNGTLEIKAKDREEFFIIKKRYKF